MTLQGKENRQEAAERRAAEAERLNEDAPNVLNEVPHHHFSSTQAKSDFLPYHEGGEVQLFTHHRGNNAPETASAQAVKSVDVSAAEVRNERKGSEQLADPESAAAEVRNESEGKKLADPESAFDRTPRNNLFARFTAESRRWWSSGSSI